MNEGGGQINIKNVTDREVGGEDLHLNAEQIW